MSVCNAKKNEAKSAEHIEPLLSPITAGPSPTRYRLCPPALLLLPTRKHGNYRRDPNKSGGGTQIVASPPTAYIAQANFSLALAEYILGEYNWRHRGDFSISTSNPLNGPILYQNLR